MSKYFLFYLLISYELFTAREGIKLLAVCMFVTFVRCETGYKQKTASFKKEMIEYYEYIQ